MVLTVQVVSSGPARHCVIQEREDPVVEYSASELDGAAPMTNGSANPKLLPLPTALSRERLVPCFSAIHFARARPKPEPREVEPLIRSPR
jgi:hypothetical protein